MLVHVACPGCPAIMRIPAAELNSRGTCPDCGLEIVFASPVGKRAGSSPPAERPPRAGTRNAERPRLPVSLMVVLAGLAFVGVAGFCVAAYLLLRPQNDGVTAAPTVRVPGGPAVRPDPDKPPPTAPGPVAVVPARTRTVKLPDPVYLVNTADCGRLLVMSAKGKSKLLVYGVREDAILCTIEPRAMAAFAATRTKIFVGSPLPPHITRYNARTGEQEVAGSAFLFDFNDRLAAPPNADGPLAVVSSVRDRLPHKVTASLYDADTFKPIRAKVNDAMTIDKAFFPKSFAKVVEFPHPRDMQASVHFAGSGRVLALGERQFVRTGDGFDAFPINPSSGVRPSPDGVFGVGNTIYTADGRRGMATRYPWTIPAADGPFVVGIDYLGGKNVRFVLHHTDTTELGELPSDLVAEEWNRNPGRFETVGFVPDPPYLVTLDEDRTTLRLTPVDLPGLLRKAGRPVVFTSIPPVAARRGAGYTHTATAAAADGSRPVISLVSGPPGMTVSADGKVAWTPAAAFDAPTAEFTLKARSGEGQEAIQVTQLFFGPR